MHITRGSAWHVKLQCSCADFYIELDTSDAADMFSFDCLKPEEKQWTIILGRIGVAAYLCAKQILAVVDSVDLVAELATKSGQRRMEGVTSCLRKVGSCVLAEHDRTSVETFD